jgi:signal transduction histidine kinase
MVPSGIAVDGEPDSAAEVVLALLDNARRHAAGSPVTVRAAVIGDAVELYVEDRGSGIPRRLRECIFDRGVRGGESDGSGLGLYIARRLMSEQGGSITVRSRRGGGTSFMLRFQRTRSR